MGRRETFWGGRRGLESSKILVGLLSLLITIKGVYTTQGGGGQSLKYKRVSLNETLEFPFWCPNIYIDFDIRDSERWRI